MWSWLKRNVDQNKSLAALIAVSLVLFPTAKYLFDKYFGNMDAYVNYSDEKDPGTRGLHIVLQNKTSRAISKVRVTLSNLAPEIAKSAGECRVMLPFSVEANYMEKDELDKYRAKLGKACTGSEKSITLPVIDVIARDSSISIHLNVYVEPNIAPDEIVKVVADDINVRYRHFKTGMVEIVDEVRFLIGFLIICVILMSIIVLLSAFGKKYDTKLIETAYRLMDQRRKRDALSFIREAVRNGYELDKVKNDGKFVALRKMKTFRDIVGS